MAVSATPYDLPSRDRRLLQAPWPGRSRSSSIFLFALIGLCDGDGAGVGSVDGEAARRCDGRDRRLLLLPFRLLDPPGHPFILRLLGRLLLAQAPPRGLPRHHLLLGFTPGPLDSDLAVVQPRLPALRERGAGVPHPAQMLDERQPVHASRWEQVEVPVHHARQPEPVLLRQSLPATPLSRAQLLENVSLHRLQRSFTGIRPARA